MVLVIHAKLGAFKLGFPRFSSSTFFPPHSPLSSVVKMNLKNETNALGEKHASDVPAYEPAKLGEHERGGPFSIDPEDHTIVATNQNLLHRDLKGRHMQMIAM